MNRLDDILRRAVEERVFPGGAYAVGSESGTWFGNVGRQTYAPDSPAIGESTLWDLASLTKVIAATPAAMLACHGGLLDLDAPIREFVPEFTDGEPTVRDLLLHRSGLPAYVQVTDLRTKADVWDRICAAPLEYEPRTAVVYSCVGFVVLHHVLEAVVGTPLDVFVKERLFGPLGMRDTCYRPDLVARPRCAPTEALLPWRRELEDVRGFVRVQDEFVQGDVHDPIACVLGGVSANAGLFSTAADVAAYLRMILNGHSKILPIELLEEWTRPTGPESSRALGWDTKSPVGSSAGSRFSSASFGHTGYTGTSVWVDPVNHVFAALLTNRVHPTSDNVAIAEFRPRFHDAVFGFLGSATG